MKWFTRFDERFPMAAEAVRGIAFLVSVGTMLFLTCAL
jgi:hypothetical protein